MHINVCVNVTEKWYQKHTLCIHHDSYCPCITYAYLFSIAQLNPCKPYVHGAYIILNIIYVLFRFIEGRFYHDKCVLGVFL